MARLILRDPHEIERGTDPSPGVPKALSGKLAPGRGVAVVEDD